MRRPALIRSLAIAVFAAACFWLTAPLRPARSAPTPATWYKGNLHTHTINSDGDTSPDEVVRWYKEHRYNFLVLTDHNYLTSVDGLNAVMGADGQFLVVRGEEVTDRFEDKPVHVNAFNPKALVPPQHGSSVLDTIQRNVDAIRGAEAVPSINHPNFGWAITADDLRRVQNDKLFEIYNGHPQVNNLGGGGVPGLERVWDTLLTAGRVMYGIAVDDAHNFKQFAPHLSNPGRGWVSIHAPELTAAALIDGLERGDFYASTGVVLDDVERRSRELRLQIHETRPLKYTIEFIGENSRVLKTTFDNPASYQLGSTDRYVRAKVTASSGEMAWTQPVFRQ
ncbi:MAG TPA: CehA/McbA family metallohydrolase [Bryobacterales bacterium]|nr:CehA/McbA family metallohydrolase [Bryobacterales bacterium]